METAHGACGILCTECPAYQAYLTDDDDLRKKTAKEWSRQYLADITPASINCSGCINPGIKFAHCAECEIRNCASQNNLITCADCDYYPCPMLMSFFTYVPQAEENLKNLKK